jgi:uncharacterized membrane protein YkoI
MRKNRMLKKLQLVSAVAALAIGGTALAATAPAPKISKAQARAMALKLAPGKIKEGEYEFERGAWRWSFDIQMPGHIQEVGIDAQTGKVVENSNEGKVDHDG